MTTKKQITTLQASSKALTSVAFSPDGKCLASASGDETVRLWDAETHEQIAELQGHKGWVSSVVFSPNGRWLASASEDSAIRLWNVATKELVTEFTENSGSGTQFWDTQSVFSIAFSPDGKLLASGSKDKVVRIWNAQSGGQIARLEGHANWVHCVAFSPNGKLLASGSRDKTVLLWDVVSREQIAKIGEYPHWVHDLAFSADGKVLASGLEDKTIRLWDIWTQKPIAVLEGHTEWVNTVCFSPDGRLLASGAGDRTIHLWGINLVMTKAEKIEYDQHIREHQEEDKRLRYERAEQAIRAAGKSLDEAITEGAEKHALAEIQATRALQKEARAALDEERFEAVKPLANRVKLAAPKIRELVQKGIIEDRRRNNQCLECGKLLGFLAKFVMVKMIDDTFVR